MSSPTQLYSQLFKLLSQYSFYKDLRHLKALAWMIQALLLSGKINLSEWEPYIQLCMIHVSIVCGRRAIPFLWKVIEHKSATVSFAEYKPLLKIAQKLIDPRFSDVMLLADRGFANHQLIQGYKRVLGTTVYVYLAM